MSNPCLNRWGSNIYWEKLWYSQKHYANNLKQDSLFLELVNTFLFYGVEIPKPLYISKYWHHLNLWLERPKYDSYYKSYYRWHSYNNFHTGEFCEYRLKVETKDIYPMKVWVFKFNNWILINFYWYQPNKKTVRKANYRHRMNFVNVFYKSTPELSSLRRYKLFLSKNLFSIFYRRHFYTF